MNPRERVLAAIRHEVPDRIPVDAICIENATAVAQQLGIPDATVADRLGEGAGYICGPDHHIKPDVPAANVIALFETARTYARDGYTQNVVAGR